MLHKETVQPTTLELIKKLQRDNNLHGFYLVGGTALALQIGHRISDDIDLFTNHPFDSNKLAEYMEINYQMSIHYLHNNTLKGFINNVLIDLITHNYDLVESEIEVEGIKMLSKKDIDTASWPRMMLEKNLTLEKIKTSIIDHQMRYLK